MEDSFRVRVDKVFGSLSGSSSSSWSLTDEEIQKKEWIRDSPIRQFDDEADTIINSKLDSGSNFDQDLQSDLQNLDHDVGNDNERDDDELEVRASIGLDCTLDFEEEEDEYDKVAIGKEKSGDRLYMKDINDRGTDVNTFHELPVGFHDVSRDPRANHLAAKLRLEEDSEAAGGFHSSKLSKTSKAISNSLSNAEADITYSQDDGDGGRANPKPILKNKKRDHQRVSKSQKRVRFDTTSDTTKVQNQETSNITLTKTGDSPVRVSQPTMDRSRYTHYTLESSDDMNEESNREAYLDSLNLIKKPDDAEMQSNVDFSEPPIFTPRKSSMVDSESKSKKDVSNYGISPICIAVGDVEENKVSAMEEDDSPMDDKDVCKSGRQYRTKSKIDVE